jgi:uncharacterized protein (DUF1330 family)
MTFYLVAHIKVTDQKWVPAYAAAVHGLLHKHGAKYLARSANITTLEGEPSDSTFIALIEFPSMEAVQAFANDPAYAPFGKSRQRGSVSRLYLIDNTDTAGMIPDLPKANALDSAKSKQQREIVS